MLRAGVRHTTVKLTPPWGLRRPPGAMSLVVSFPVEAILHLSSSQFTSNPVVR